MLTVFKRIFKDRGRGLVIYSVAAVLFAEMYIALFPALKEQADMLNTLLEAYPKSLMSAFGFDGTAAFFSRLENFMSTEYFSFLWPILAIIMLVGFANAMVAGEVEKGTIEVTLAQPISRLQVFMARYTAGLVYFGVFSIVSIFSIPVLAILNNIDYAFPNYFTTLWVGFLFGAAIFSIACFFSAIFSEKGKAAFATTGVVLLMYVANVVSTLKESWQNIRYFSFFYYFNAATVLGKNEIVQYTVPVLLTTAILFAVAAAIWFNRRDLAV
jgi:ABC-2 type transport system permease protein